jgi:hypothetical protein
VKEKRSSAKKKSPVGEPATGTEPEEPQEALAATGTAQ